uniref:Uncharacterized protein n=1 Tax=Toxoplasma gondii COUG TaxID=1074873 RepID=A0A2G8Y7L6_TOXGO|nr:hypothetical protein TGCOUG_231470 [Toxoplasma gondii COUG]
MSDSFCGASLKNGREERPACFSERCGSLLTPPAGRQSALRSGHTTDPLELEERYGSSKELLRGCRIVPPHLNEGHSSNMMAKVREMRRPARPFHPPSPPVAKSLGGKMKSQYDKFYTTLGNSVPCTTVCAIHREKKRDEYTAPWGSYSSQENDTADEALTPRALPLGDAQPQLSHGRMRNGVLGRSSLSTFPRKQERVIRIEENNLTKRGGLLCHSNGTPLPPPVSVEITERLTSSNQSSCVAVVTSSSPSRRYARSPPPSDSTKTRSVIQNSDDIRVLKPGINKATTLSIDTWLEPFRKRINILSDLCKDMVHHVEVMISRHRLVRGSVHNTIEEGKQPASINRPTCKTISFEDSSYSTQPRMQGLEICRKGSSPKTTVAEGGSTQFSGFDLSKWRPAVSPSKGGERNNGAGEGCGATGEASSGLSQPTSFGAASSETVVTLTSRNPATYSRGSSSTPGPGWGGDEEHVRVAVFTKQLAELAVILRITNPDAVKRKLFVAENCPLLIPPNEADDFFAFSIILYSLTLPQSYRWNQGVYRLSPTVSSSKA